jgi:DNA-binding FadR family transcriptional regulator
VELVEQRVAPALVGRDPSQRAPLLEGLARGLAFAPFTVAGVETALLDLLGRVLDVPVHVLLGGAFRDRVEVHGSVGWDDDAARIVELAEFRLSFEADNAWWAARRADAQDIASLTRLVTETRRELKAITDDWTPLTEADARWHEALAHATKNRLRIGISLGLHEPRLRQVPALGAAHARYARTIPTALARITRAVRDHDPDAARRAMLDHIEQWNRLNPDIRDLERPD